MKYIAHRGYKNNSLENQIPSFINAINDDYFSGFELDIRQSKDKKIMVIHDPFINRVTNKSGLVKNMSAKELQKLNIPLLEDILKLETNKLILIEIRDFDINLKNLLKVLDKYKKKKIYLMSFYESILNNLIKLKIKYKIGIVKFTFTNIENINEYDFIALHKRSINNKIIDFFKDKELFIWTINNKKEIDESIKGKDKLYLIVDKKI